MPQGGPRILPPWTIQAPPLSSLEGAVPVSEYIRKLRQQIGHELLLLPGVAAVIRNEAGEVLLVQASDGGQWGLPAGAVDPGECPAEALVREVWEETGLRVRPERIIGVFGGNPLLRTTYPNGDRCEYTAVVFFCHVVGGKLHARDGEAAALAWVAPDRLPECGIRYPAEIFAAGDGPALFQWSDRWIPGADAIGVEEDGNPAAETEGNSRPEGQRR